MPISNARLSKCKAANSEGLWTTIWLMDVFVKQPIFNIMIWNHPLESNQKKHACLEKFVGICFELQTHNQQMAHLATQRHIVV